MVCVRLKYMVELGEVSNTKRIKDVPRILGQLAKNL